MATRQRSLYTGSQRKLVIAIDVGTTFSGVSYAFLDPGMVPQIQPVTQYLGQKEPRGDSKVPSVVCYDQVGNVVAVGAETDPETNPTLEEVVGLVRAEWFKLRLRPPHLLPSQEFELQKLSSFPKNKTPIQVFGDFLRYLFQSTKQYIKESEIWSWNSIEDNVYFVLSHPNGWEGKQQSIMRRSAIAAGLARESEARERITFVTEGEASLHFCLNKNPNLFKFNAMNDMIVADCGGGTIDISSYSGSLDGGFKETTTPECLFQGSVFVTLRAQKYFKEKLRDSEYGSDGDVKSMADAFDKVTKITFNGPNAPYFVRFGRLRDTDPRHEIQRGSIKVPGNEVASFFEPAIDHISRVLDDQRMKSAANVKAVFLVGGFARSNYLFSRLTGYFNPRGVSIYRVDTTHLNKAVADGAVSYYLDHYVSARVARHSYGIRVHHPFNPASAEHVRRQHTTFMRADGTLCIPGIFSTVLKKDTVVSEETEFRQNYMEYFTPQGLMGISSKLTYLQSYQGRAVVTPKWVDTESNSFHHACTMCADITSFESSLKQKKNGNKTYYTLDFDVVMLFGHTELKAFVAWKENGIEKRQASIVYEDEVTEAKSEEE